MSTPPAAAEALGFAPPGFAAADLSETVRRAYGLSGTFDPLPGERDRNHRLTTPDGTRYVVKASGRDEDPALVDFQTRALLHIGTVAPDLPVPRVLRTADGALSTTVADADGAPHILRVLSWLPGVPLFRMRPLPPATLGAVGRLQGRLALALRGFFHPAARRFMPWDLTNGLVLDAELRRAMPPDAARLAGPALDRLAALLPRLPALRAQVIHHDAHLGNLLGDPAMPDAVTGIIDFGDLVHAPLVLDLATSLAGIAEDRADFADAAEAVAAGFHAVLPLEDAELACLFDLTLGRLILTVQFTAVKAAAPDAAPSLLEDELPCYVDALRRLSALDPAAVTQRLRAACSLAAPHPATTTHATTESSDPDTPALIRRRKAALGPGSMHFYRQPLHIVGGRDVWLTDADGREYLDCYNNVPSVGHCHPHVVEAIARQAATLNTHTRYLHGAVVVYAERLAAALPGDLSTCLFACTGSEANDLALRIARTVTGNEGAIVTEHAYHGTTLATTQLSTGEYPAAERPAWLATVPPPDLYRGPAAGARDPGAACAAFVAGAIETLRARGIRPALFMHDAIFDAPGIHTAPPGYLPAAYAAIRAAGGLVVADEVQAGLCRLGDHFWGFEDSGVVPDIVTIGKPMGNGHPLAAVITTPDIAAAFARRFGYFNTFAGNPVSAAAGLAVLDVVERENLLANAAAAGAALAAGLARLAERHPVIGDTRGKGLFRGVELVRDRATGQPAPDLALRVVELMRGSGVLIAASGPRANVLKLRPPLTFRPEHAERVVEALDRVLSETG